MLNSNTFENGSQASRGPPVSLIEATLPRDRWNSIVDDFTLLHQQYSIQDPRVNAGYLKDWWALILCLFLTFYSANCRIVFQQ
jgi:hypothetical protein